MATLVFSAVGTALGGPLGGALGALVGNQLDRAIAGSPKREGPRLRELAVTTSSYGTAIARHFGRVRAPGSIIWATDLQEAKEGTRGSKGSPSVTTYAYSASFAVALASRPIQGLGRVWADGNLLRGTAGDLKVGGSLRIYSGYGDQNPDPLIASDRGQDCPAFRNLAYCVFEDLQLADFGNRIPSLTFEIIADTGTINLSDVIASIATPISTTTSLPELIGFSDEGGPLSASLTLLDKLYPITCDGSGIVLELSSSDLSQSACTQLSEPVVDPLDDGFGGLSGRMSRRQNYQNDLPNGLRYYDVDRDFQVGLQRAEGRSQTGRNQVLDFPGVLQANTARHLCHSILQRANWAGDQLLWRVAEIDPSLKPGQVVSVPGRAGTWRVMTWEWRTSGVELELLRMPPGPAKTTPSDAGAFMPPKDAPLAPTILVAFELPGSGAEPANERLVYAAASSPGNGWTGAALYAEEQGTLAYLQTSGSRRSVVGSLATTLGTTEALLVDRQSTVDVQFIADDFYLANTTVAGLADGLNRALVGDEILQFVHATSLGMGRWQLSGLLRGRGGTEAAALTSHPAGTSFVLLNDRPVRLNNTSAAISTTQSIAAIGLADDNPATSSIGNSGISRKPPMPVHPRKKIRADGSWCLSWTRRARGSWAWDQVGEVPLVEQAELYRVGVGSPDTPAIFWEVTEPQLVLDAAELTALQTSQLGAQVWVKQIGTFAPSDPVLLATIN